MEAPEAIEPDYMEVDPDFVEAVLANLPEDEKHIDPVIYAISHRLVSYPVNPLTLDCFGAVRYSENWISFFCAAWPLPFEPVNTAYKEAIEQ